jgi:hypothetical protein
MQPKGGCSAFDNPILNTGQQYDTENEQKATSASGHDGTLRGGFRKPVWRLGVDSSEISGLI